jgi:ribosomal peptide maturation radical SAM protein 1
MKIALVVMPLAAADRPSLAVGLMQASLKARGFECHAKYFNVLLWKMLGDETYSGLAQRASMTSLGGEWAFSQAYWGTRFSNWESYSREVLEHPVWGAGSEERESIHRLKELAPSFLRLAFECCDWGQYDLVGFTSTFEQTMPSLCLARMIRERYPRVKLVMGGANFEGGMGRPYLEHFDFLDYVSTGEADDSFPRLCENLRDGRREVPPGFLYREGGELLESPRERGMAPTALDALPTPDFEDFFRVVRASTPGGQSPVSWLPVEASRGCWWGERSHCTFCGLNGETMTFRKKSWRRVADESEELVRRHGVGSLQFSDNILAMSYFQELLPYWAKQPEGPRKFFEIKSNLKRHQVGLLRAAKITTVQAGVESLLDGTLKLMRKGVTGAQNVALLRWCTEVGIRPWWNLLYGFPGEDLAGYAELRELMEKLVHLAPPVASAPIRMDRFSPNFMRWREHGFTRMEPMPAYRHVFPFPEDTLRELAYFFQYEHPQFGQALELGSGLEAFRQSWVERAGRGESGELAVKPHGQGGYVLVDTRFTRPRSEVPLDEDTLALLLACDAPTSQDAALKSAVQARPGREVELAARLKELLAQNVVARVGSLVVTLALLPEDLSLQPLRRAN